MGPSWGHAGLSFVEVLITLAPKDSPTMFAGHVACAAFADDAGKTRESLGSRDLVLCACFTATRRTVGRSRTGGGRRRTNVRTSSIFTDHAPAQATCPAQCNQDSFLSDSGIWPAQRPESCVENARHFQSHGFICSILFCPTINFVNKAVFSFVLGNWLISMMDEYSRLEYEFSPIRLLGIDKPDPFLGIGCGKNEFSVFRNKIILNKVIGTRTVRLLVRKHVIHVWGRISAVVTMIDRPQ